jgi:hypothetical protein
MTIDDIGKSIDAWTGILEASFVANGITPEMRSQAVSQVMQDWSELAELRTAITALENVNNESLGNSDSAEGVRAAHTYFSERIVPFRARLARFPEERALSERFEKAVHALIVKNGSFIVALEQFSTLDPKGLRN